MFPHENNLLPLSKETISWRRSFIRTASIHGRVVALNGAGGLRCPIERCSGRTSPQLLSSAGLKIIIIKKEIKLAKVHNKISPELPVPAVPTSAQARESQPQSEPRLPHRNFAQASIRPGRAQL